MRRIHRSALLDASGSRWQGMENSWQCLFLREVTWSRCCKGPKADSSEHCRDGGVDLVRCEEETLHYEGGKALEQVAQGLWMLLPWNCSKTGWMALEQPDLVEGPCLVDEQER